ncbi:MAG: heavy metal translocating P-type ATPase [Myxococcota bacterium]
MIISGLLLGSALLFTGTELFRAKTKSRSAENDEQEQSIATRASTAPPPDREEPQDSSRRDLKIATASLGLVLAGAVVPAALYAGLAGLAYLFVPIAKLAYRDIVHKRRFTFMVLEVIVLPATILAGGYLLAAVSYWFLFVTLDWIARAQGRTGEILVDIFAVPASRTVWAVYDGAEVQVSLEKVRHGDILVVEAGESVPVDGEIVEGVASIDERMLTGESEPVDKYVGDEVFASTMMLAGRISMVVRKTGAETIAAQVSETLDQMTSYNDELELRSIQFADRLALPYFGLGSLATAFRGIYGGLAVLWFPLDDVIYSFGPLGVLNHLNIALERGILIKDGRALETLLEVDTVVFDKTGTLTREQPEVLAIHTCAGVSDAAVLGLAAGAERKQGHPIARAILEAARVRGIVPPPMEQVTYEVGYGIRAWLDSQRILVGSERFMSRESVSLPPTLQAVRAQASEQGSSLTYVARGDEVVGIIELQAAIRPGTTELIATLGELGLATHIISGDNEIPTRCLAKRVGIDGYTANALPQQKAEIIERLQRDGKVVCYVGDGINDGIALKQAEVSVSLRGASTIATDTAQIILMNERLDQLIELLELSRSLDKNFKRTVAIGVIPSLAITGGVFVLHFQLPAAIALYAAGMLSGSVNAMAPLLGEYRRKRALRDAREPGPAEAH